MFLVVAGCFQRQLPATSCMHVPLCARIRLGSVLFIGTVLDPGFPAEAKPGATQNVRFQVDEIFEGLPAATREAVVTAEGPWFLKGHSYLMDTGRGTDGHLHSTICGTSSDLTSPDIEETLDFLRKRANGKTETSLSVRVTGSGQPLPDADVTIAASAGRLTTRTGADGIAMFSGIKPVRYAVQATREHYHPDTESYYSDSEVDVVAGTCPSAMVALRADSAVGGRVVNSKGEPVKLLELELVTAPENPSEELSLHKPSFEATTDAEGAFVFDAVSPGRYLLGSNIIDQNSSLVPATFYPGQRTREGAYPIEVKLGERIENVIFTLPDFGSLREIQLCVIDEKGKSVTGASLDTEDFEHTGGNFAGLVQNLITDQTGCVTTRGYSKVAYPLSANLRPADGSFWGTRFSDNLVIEPGEEPVHRVLVLDQTIDPPK